MNEIPQEPPPGMTEVDSSDPIGRLLALHAWCVGQAMLADGMDMERVRKVMHRATGAFNGEMLREAQRAQFLHQLVEGLAPPGFAPIDEAEAPATPGMYL